MSDFKSMGLLDFQSKGTQITPLLNNFSMKGDLQQQTMRLSYHQDQNLESTEASNHSMRNASSPAKTCNLEDLLSSTSLMYVSGDSQGLDSSKLQLEFCKEPCCNSRVKYATVHRGRDKDSDVWSINNSNKFNSIAPLPGTNNARSSWDLGSDGASTPGSSSWGEALGGSGLARSSSQWPGPQVPDLGFGSSNAVFFDTSLTRGGAGLPVSFVDTWGATDAFYETDKSFGNFRENGTESIGDRWNKAIKSSWQPKQ